MNLYEIHSHTSEVSVCSNVRSKELVLNHKNRNFKGVCITDHYYKGFFDNYYGRDKKYIVERFLEGYKIAKDYGEEIGLKVFLGMEIRFTESNNDYLVYGIDEKFIYENPNIYTIGLEKFIEYTKNTDILLVWAHPFRNQITMRDNKYFEAIESYNGNVRHDSRNYLANAYQKKYNLIGTCGSDYHRVEDIYTASMDFDYEINSEKHLVQAIRNRHFKHSINKGE